MRPVLFASLAGLAGVASCSEPEVGVVDQSLRLTDCDPEICGTNSQLMAHYGTWEFSIAGVRNGQGFRILGLGKGARFYNLVVRDSRILGLDATGKVALEGPDLVGARIYLDRNGMQTAIEISDVGTIREVVPPNNALDTYVLDWGEVIANRLPRRMIAGDTVEGGVAIPILGSTTPVCAPPKWIEESYVGAIWEWDETVFMGMSPFQSVVFEGDRFDPPTRTVRSTPNDSWFNIGCGAHTLAKLRLTRNTIHTAPSWTNVQAALKMLGADYCGGGTSFTFPGEPLVWRDRTAMDYLHMSASHELEARWDENGVTCISAPRLMRTGNPDAAAAYTDVWQAIQDECALRGKWLDKCGNTDPMGWDGELVTSVNYD